MTRHGIVKALLFLLPLLPASGGGAAWASEPRPSYQPDMAYYLDRAPAPEKQGIIREEVRKFRSFPHLDRAYRLVRERRLNEARGEFESYLALAPDDLRSRVSYMSLLDRMSLDAEVISQADIILGRCPGFVPAYLFKGWAFRKQGKWREALAAFAKASDEKPIRKEDRVIALSAAAEIALSHHLYAEARTMLQPLAEIEKTSSGYMKTGYVLEKTGNLKEALSAYDTARNLARSPREKGVAALALAETAKKLNLRERAKEAYRSIVDYDGYRQQAARSLADLAYAGKEYDAAIKWMLLLERHGLKPDDRRFLANLYLKKQDYAAAISELKALAAQEGKKPSLETLAILGQTYESAGRLRESAATYKLLVMKAPENGAVKLRYGNLLVRLGRLEEARPLLISSLSAKLAPEERRSAHKNLSLIYEKAGNHEKALLELEQSLIDQPRPEPDLVLRRARLLGRTGRAEAALHFLDRLLAEPSLAVDLRRAALREKGLLLEKDGHPLEAAGSYEKLLMLGDRSPALYAMIANLYQSGKKPESAIGYLNKVIEHPNAATSEKCSAQDGLGLIYFNRGRMEESISHFSEAVKLCGDTWQRRYYEGLAYYRLKRMDQALAQFLLAEKQKKDVATLMGIALCHKELNRPGAAIHYLLRALRESGGISHDQLEQIYGTLGYLYAEEHAYDKAADAYTRALAHTPNPVITLKLAGALHRAGKSGQAWKILNNVDGASLPRTEIIEYNDVKSGMLQKLGRNEEAMALLEKNQKLEPTSARNYTLGQLYQHSGRLDKSIASFRAAYEADPRQDEYALALGYAYAADRRFADAIAVLETVAARTPGSVKVLEDLGYLNSKIGNNEKAAQWFKQALDRFPEVPQNGSGESELWDKDAYRIRSEITKLTKTFRADLYASYRAGKAPRVFIGGGEQSYAGLNGDLGLETSYRPPVIGLLNDRVFEIFGRVFGNIKPNSWNYNERSTQAGVGLRYKFLQTQNLWISGEKLFKIGDDAQDDWLFRVLYSVGKGAEPADVKRIRNYYLVYGELDGYVSAKSVAFYGEVREGLSLALMGHDTLLIPHLVLDGRWQSPSINGGNYVEGGAGLTLRRFFGRTRYENYRGIMDFVITYKHGYFYSRGFDNVPADYDNALFSLRLSF